MLFWGFIELFASAIIEKLAKISHNDWLIIIVMILNFSVIGVGTYFLIMDIRHRNK